MKHYVNAKPGSRNPGVEQNGESHWTIRVREPSTEGRANEAIRKALAGALGVAPGRVTLVRGHRSKQKMFEVE